MKSVALAIRQSFDLAGHMAKAADKVCVSCSRVAKLDRTVFTFHDGSKLTITKNRYIEVTDGNRKDG